MPLDKYKKITAKAMGLILSLFDIVLVQEMPFGIPQYIHSTLTETSAWYWIKLNQVSIVTMEFCDKPDLGSAEHFLSSGPATFTEGKSSKI